MSDKEPYVQIKIPKSLMDLVDNKMGTMGYKSRPELVKDAIRRLLFDYSRFEEETDEQRP